jgi:hypothetical protein
VETTLSTSSLKIENTRLLVPLSTRPAVDTQSAAKAYRNLALKKSVPPCSACGAVSDVVAFRRLSVVVDYYLCHECGHVWAVLKSDPTVIDHITPLPKKPE